MDVHEVFGEAGRVCAVTSPSLLLPPHHGN
jgi:hypothetical protein